MTAARIAEMQRLKKWGDASMVPMDELAIMVFGVDSPYKGCLATQYLNSCRAVVIISTQAALLAHIGPRAPDSPSPYLPSGMNWIQRFMARISLLLNGNQYRRYFENQGPGGLVIFGALGGKPQGLEELASLAAAVQDIIQVPPKGIRYDVINSSDPRTENKGLVLVEGIASGQYPRIWVEDHEQALPVPGPGNLGSFPVTTSTSSPV
ncbi:MAG: hypothetical protein L6R42_000986 [Xanthoria sp. 1 TBL-2021]|nr:MAG: hypothetical protein L6R42_000986 [Xanthoria sp. 1 TBL-2021]